MTGPRICIYAPLTSVRIHHLDAIMHFLHGCTRALRVCDAHRPDLQKRTAPKAAGLFFRSEVVYLLLMDFQGKCVIEGLCEEACELMSSRQASICMAAQGAMESNVELSRLSVTALWQPGPLRLADLGGFPRWATRGASGEDASRLWRATTRETLAAASTLNRSGGCLLAWLDGDGMMPPACSDGLD